MTNQAGRYSGHEEENWRMGRKLYQEDKELQNKYGYRSHDKREWDEGNYFHTGPSRHGAQDTPERKYGENYQHDRNSTYAQGRNAHLNDHYGSESDSPYRNERAYIDHGSSSWQNTGHSMHRPQVPGGSLQGNTSDRTDYQNNIWREGPGSRSRYKEDDFRYGSGSHNWYREGRYTPDHARQHEHRGFMDKVKDTWNDIWHSDDPNYRPVNRYESRAEQVNPAERHGSEPYRDRSFDKGYEGGPRWADETDTGRDDYYKDIDRSQRYRR